MLPEALQTSRGIRGSSGITVKMRAKLVDFRGRKAHAFVVTLPIAAKTGQTCYHAFHSKMRMANATTWGCH